MIIRHIQHELFESDDRTRLVYFTFDSEGGQEHQTNIQEAKDALTDGNITAQEITELSEDIQDLQKDIRELQDLIYKEDSGGNRKNVEDLTFDDTDSAAKVEGYEPTSWAHDVFTEQAMKDFLNIIEAPNDVSSFEEQSKLYEKVWGSLMAMDFGADRPVEDWQIDAVGGYIAFPEIGLNNFIDIIDTNTLKPMSSTTVVLYNQNGVSFQVPSNPGEAYEVRSGAIRTIPGTPVQYLIPVRYGEQNLYVNFNDVDYALNGNVSTGNAGTSFLYDVGGVEFSFSKNMGASFTRQDAIEFIEAYGIAAVGGVDTYVFRQFSKAQDLLNNATSNSHYHDAISYATSALETKPNTYDAHLVIADAQIRLGNKDEAKAALELYKAAVPEPRRSAAATQLEEQIQGADALDKMRTDTDLPEHPSATREKLTGGISGIKLFSDELREKLAAWKSADTAAAAQEYFPHKNLLAWAMAVEENFANGYENLDLNSGDITLSILYFNVERGGNNTALLRELVKGQLDTKSGLDGHIDQLLTPLDPVMDVFIRDKVKAHTDLSDQSEPLKSMMSNPAELQSAVTSLFAVNPEAFNNIDQVPYGDGVLTLSVEGITYFITRETQLDKEITDYFKNGGDMAEEIIKTKDILKNGFGKDPASKDRLKRYVKKKGEAIGDPSITQADLLQRYEDLTSALGPLSPTERLQYLADPIHESDLKLLDKKTQEAVKDYIEKYRRFQADPSSGGSAILSVQYLDRSGVVRASKLESPAELYRLLAKESQTPQVKRGLKHLASSPKAKKSAVKKKPTASGTMRYGPMGKPLSPIYTTGMTVEDRKEVAETFDIELRKWKLEGRVFQGMRESKMAEVFQKSSMADLKDFYDSINRMKEAKPGEGRKIAERGSWRAIFTRLVAAQGGKTQKNVEHIVLAGRPLILYRMIERAFTLGRDSTVPVLDHGSGDEYMRSIARKRWEVSAGQHSRVEGVPELHSSAERTGPFKGLEGLKIELADPEWKDGTRVYRIHPNGNSMTEFPYVFSVERTASGYRLHYGDGEASFSSYEQLIHRGVKNVVLPRLKLRTWKDMVSYRVEEEGVDGAKIGEYYERFVSNQTEMAQEADIQGRRDSIIKGMSKESGVPFKVLENLLKTPHSELLRRVRVTKTKDKVAGVTKLPPRQLKAVILYFEKLDYVIGKDDDGKFGYEEGYIEDYNNDMAYTHLYDIAKDDILDEKRKKGEIKPDSKEKKRKASKKDKEKIPSHRPSIMAQIEDLGLRGAKARRCKKIFKKLMSKWMDQGGLTFKDEEYNRYMLARNFDEMDDTLLPGFIDMMQHSEQLIPSIKREYGKKGRDLKIITNVNTVENAIVRIARIATLGEHIGMCTAVRHVMKGTGAYGDQLADRGYSRQRTRGVYQRRRYT